MRIPWPLVALSLLCGCPEKKAADSSQPTVVRDQKASEALKRLSNTGLHTDPAVRNMQRGMADVEKKQDEGMRRAEEAAEGK